MSRSLVQQLRDENAFLREQVRTLQEKLLPSETRVVRARPAPSPQRAPSEEEKVIESAIAARSFDLPSERANRQFAQAMRARGWKPEAIAAHIERGVAPATTLEQDLGGVLR